MFEIVSNEKLSYGWDLLIIENKLVKDGKELSYDWRLLIMKNYMILSC